MKARIKLTKEQDLRNLCDSDEEYEEVIKELVRRFSSLGVSVVRTQYHGDRYYVLSTPGKDDAVSINMYGTLSLIVAVFNDLGMDLSLDQLKDIFSEVWEDIENLIQINYLQISKEKEKEMLKITPLGKAALKNVLKTLELKDFIPLD